MKFHREKQPLQKIRMLCPCTSIRVYGGVCTPICPPYHMSVIVTLRRKDFFYALVVLFFSDYRVLEIKKEASFCWGDRYAAERSFSEEKAELFSRESSKEPQRFRFFPKTEQRLSPLLPLRASTAQTVEWLLFAETTLSLSFQIPTTWRSDLPRSEEILKGLRWPLREDAVIRCRDRKERSRRLHKEIEFLRVAL